MWTSPVISRALATGPFLIAREFRQLSQSQPQRDCKDRPIHHAPVHLWPVAGDLFLEEADADGNAFDVPQGRFPIHGGYRETDGLVQVGEGLDRNRSLIRDYNLVSVPRNGIDVAQRVAESSALSRLNISSANEFRLPK